MHISPLIVKLDEINTDMCLVLNIHVTITEHSDQHPQWQS